MINYQSRSQTIRNFRGENFWWKGVRATRAGVSEAVASGEVLESSVAAV